MVKEHATEMAWLYNMEQGWAPFFSEGHIKIVTGLMAAIIFLSQFITENLFKKQKIIVLYE